MDLGSNSRKAYTGESFAVYSFIPQRFSEYPDVPASARCWRRRPKRTEILLLILGKYKGRGPLRGVGDGSDKGEGLLMSHQGRLLRRGGL